MDVEVALITGVIVFTARPVKPEKLVLNVLFTLMFTLSFTLVFTRFDVVSFLPFVVSLTMLTLCLRRQPQFLCVCPSVSVLDLTLTRVVPFRVLRTSCPCRTPTLPTVVRLLLKGPTSPNEKPLSARLNLLKQPMSPFRTRDEKLSRRAVTPRMEILRLITVPVSRLGIHLRTPVCTKEASLLCAQ